MRTLTLTEAQHTHLVDTLQRQHRATQSRTVAALLTAALAAPHVEPAASAPTPPRADARPPAATQASVAPPRAHTGT